MSHSRKPRILVHISVLAVINYKILAPSLCISIFFLEFGILELEFPTNQIQHSSCAIFYFELLLSNPKYFLTSLSSLYGVLLLPDKTSKNITNTSEKMGFEIFFLYAGFLYENNQPPHQLLSKDEKRRRDRRTKRVALRYYYIQTHPFTTSFIVEMINLSSTVVL